MYFFTFTFLIGGVAPVARTTCPVVKGPCLYPLVRDYQARLEKVV